MKYSIPRKIDEGLEADGIIFFAQRMEEMLANSSIDLYKMPLLNTHGLASEYRDVSKKVNEGTIREYQRNIVFEEFVSSFSSDIILKENWGKDNIERVVKSFGGSNQKEKDETIAYIDAILDNGKYLNWIKETLQKYTAIPKEKKKIEAALRSLLPELIKEGYDAEFILETLRIHFFKGKLITRNTVKEFLDVFDLSYHSYKVYFSVSTTVEHFESTLKERLNVQFVDDGNYGFFKTDRNKTIIYFENIVDRCPNSAAKQANQILDIFFSFYKFVGDKRSLSMQNKAMVIEGALKPVFVSSKPQTFSVVENIDYAALGKQSENLLTGLLVNARNEYFMLSKAIELHNTAISITDLKSGFSNLWSSLEVLAQGKEGDSKLTPVLNMVLPILKKDYIGEQVDEFTVALKDNLSEEAYKEIISELTTVGCERRKVFELIFLEDYIELRSKLMEKLSKYPVLRSRLSLLSSMTTTKKLKGYIEAYIERINWHLYRMYRTRNAIVHSGEIPDNLKPLGEHLHSYVDSTASEFILKLAGDIPFRTREDIFTDLKFAISKLDSSLEKNCKIDKEIIDTLIHPEIGYILKCDKH